MLYSANITLNDSFGSHPPLAIGGENHMKQKERCTVGSGSERRQLLLVLLYYLTVHDWRYLCRTLICNGCQATESLATREPRFIPLVLLYLATRHSSPQQNTEENVDTSLQRDCDAAGIPRVSLFSIACQSPADFGDTPS